jgi:hypothetical protein
MRLFRGLIALADTLAAPPSPSATARNPGSIQPCSKPPARMARAGYRHQGESIRGSDSQMIGRILIENRGGRQTFILRPEGQKLLTRRGRIPTRPDVEIKPPGMLQALHTRKVMPSTSSPRKIARRMRCSRKSSWGVHDSAVRVSAVEKIGARNPNE